MPFVFEAQFDSHGDARVRRVWQAIEQSGLRCAPADAGYVPHISLAVFEDLELAAARAMMQKFCRARKAFNIAMAAYGGFATPGGIAFLLPAVTDDLLRLHSDFQQAVAGLKGTARGHYQPGIWIPHCTVNYGMEPADWQKLASVLNQVGLPITVRIESVALAEVGPGLYRVHAREALSA